MKEIKTKSKYTKETLKNFLEIYFFERIKIIRIILNIFIIVTTISFFTTKDKTTLDIIAFIFSLIALLEINTSMIPRLNYFTITKKKNSILDTEVSYVFKKNNFKLNQNEYIDYTTLNKIIETENYFFLYVNSSRALIVDKKQLNKDELLELTKRFKENVTTYKNKKDVR